MGSNPCNRASIQNEQEIILLVRCYGAGDGIRTRAYQLGKLGPYHLATPAKV